MIGEVKKCGLIVYFVKVGIDSGEGDVVIIVFFFIILDGEVEEFILIFLEIVGVVEKILKKD